MNTLPWPVEVVEHGYSAGYNQHRIPLPSTQITMDIRSAWNVRQTKKVHNTAYIKRLIGELRGWRELNRRYAAGEIKKYLTA